MNETIESYKIKLSCLNPEFTNFFKGHNFLKINTKKADIGGSLMQMRGEVENV